MLKLSLDSTNIGVVKVVAKNPKFGLDNACAVLSISSSPNGIVMRNN